MTGPQRPELVIKILKELKKHSDGLWVRRLARNLNEPTMTVHKYVTTTEDGYPGGQIEIVKKLPRELGGHIIIRLKR